jgi:hypothetical protein
MKNFWSKIIAGFVTIAAVLTLSANVQAADLGGNPSVNLSENRAGLTSNYTIQFTSTSGIPASGIVDIVFPVQYSDADLAGATLGTTSANLGTTANGLSASVTGKTVRVVLGTNGVVAPGADVSIQLDGIVNTATVGNDYQLIILTYQSDGTTLIDNGASFDFSIQPRGPNQANSTIATNPAGITSMVVGSTIQVDFTAEDALGNVLPNQSVEWTVSDSSFGLSSSSGITNASGVDSVTLTAPTEAGLSTTVTARSGDFSYNITLTTASIVTTHDVLNYWDISCIASQTAGNEFTFIVTPFDQYDNVLTDYDWATLANRPTFAGLTDMPGHSVAYTFVSATDGVATYRVTPYADQDDASITATFGSITGTSNYFDVEHNIATSIAVTPDSSTITAGGDETYVVTAADTYGNTWNVTADSTFQIVGGGDGGSWNGDTYTSRTAGTWTVRASYNALTDDAVLTVDHNLTTDVTITPDETQNIIAGDHIDFTATAYDAYGNLTGDTVTWTGTSAADSGLFNNTTADSYTVYATACGVNSISVTVNVSPADLHHITITPSDQTITAGDTIQFTAEGYDVYNNIIEGLTFTWDNTDAAGLFTNTTANDYPVQAHSGVVDSNIVNITVIHDDAVSIAINPAGPLSLNADETQLFDATATDFYGNTWNITSSADWYENDPTGFFFGNLYNAGTVGAWSIHAGYNLLTSNVVTANVSHGAAVSIGITPVGDIDLTADDTQMFTATATDADGNTWNASDAVTWNENDPLGSFTNNTYNAGLVGSWTISASLGLLDSNNVTVNVTHGDAWTIVVNPLGPIDLTADGSQTFTAMAYDADGNNWDVTDQVTWNDNDPAGFFTTNTYFAGSVGQWTISASLGSINSNDVTVNVSHGAAVIIYLSPVHSDILAGNTQSYEVSAADTDGNYWDVTEDSFFQIVGGGDNGTWTNNVYTSHTAGTWTVRATYNTTLTDDSTLDVDHNIATTVIIDPNTEQNITAGDHVDFTATAYDAYGNLTDDAVIWTGTSAADSGLFDNATAGTYTVYATVDGVQSTHVTVIVAHNNAVSITVAPDSSTILAGNTQTYTVTAHDAYNNTWDVTNDSTFEIVDIAHHGSWQGNVYTSHTAGTWTVEATYNTLTDEATLIVNPNVLDRIDVSPDSTQTITAGSTVQFTAEGYDAYDNLISGLTFEWNNATSTGLFNTTTAGTYDVYASVGDIDSNDVDVIVNPGLAATIDVQPSTATDVSADTHQSTITATVRDQYGNLVSDGTQVDWVSSNSSFTLLVDHSHTINGIATITLTTTTHAGDTGTVTGTVNAHSNTTGLFAVVHGTVDHIAIDPTSADIDQSGHTRSFTVAAYDQYGNAWDVTAYTTFSIDGDDAFGRLSDGTYTAGQIGTHHVYASYSGKTATTTVNVLDHATVSSISITNKITSLYVGSTHNYQVRFRDAYGNSWDGTTLVIWTISAGDFASIDANGLLTGVLPGTTTITATYGSHHDDDDVNVLAAIAGGVTSELNTPLGNEQSAADGAEVTTVGPEAAEESTPNSNDNWSIIFYIGLALLLLGAAYYAYSFWMPTDAPEENTDTKKVTRKPEPNGHSRW